MKSTRISKGMETAAAVACMVLGFALFASAAPDAPKAAAAPAGPSTRPAGTKFTLRYKPTVTDAPASRGWGAARSAAGAPPPKVYVISPADFAGTTARATPTLYWYISEPTKRSIEIAITPVTDAQGKPVRLADPVLSLTLKGVEKPGLQPLDLTKKGPGGKDVTLAQGVTYKWVVEFVSSETDGARNPHAECMLKRVDEPAALRDAALSPADAAAAYAEAGVWYDAVVALNKAIADDPQSTSLREARRELLKSQKLIEDEQGRITDATEAKPAAAG